MKLKNYTLLVVGILLSLFLFGCGGAEDGDLIPPNFTFDGGIPTVTADPGTLALPHHFSGTTDPGSEVDVTVNFPTTDPVPTITTPTPVVQPDGAWSFDVYGLVEGSNIFAIDVSDPIGNSTVYYVTIVLDLTGPTVSLDQFISYTSLPIQTIAGTIGEVNASIEYCIIWSSNASCDPSLPVWSPMPPANVDGTLWKHQLDLSWLQDSYTVVIRGIDHLGSYTDAAEYASADIDYFSTAPAFTVSTPPTLPVILSDPINSSVAALAGTYDSTNFDLVLSTSPAIIPVFDDTSVADTWTLDFADVPAGNTVATFSIQDLASVEVAQANILIVRDLSGPLLIKTVPAHGATTVNTATTFVLTFSETMDAATVTNEMIVLTDDQGTVVPFTITSPSADSLNREFTFTPDSALVAGTKYSMSVVNPAAQAATDFYGNSFVPPTSLFKFTTATP